MKKMTWTLHLRHAWSLAGLAVARQGAEPAPYPDPAQAAPEAAQHPTGRRRHGAAWKGQSAVALHRTMRCGREFEGQQHHGTSP